MNWNQLLPNIEIEATKRTQRGARATHKGQTKIPDFIRSGPKKGPDFQEHKETAACDDVKIRMQHARRKRGIFDVSSEDTAHTKVISRSSSNTRKVRGSFNAVCLWSNALEKPDALPILKCTVTHGSMKKSKAQQPRNTTRSVHFASLVDFCHLKHNELAKHSQNTNKGQSCSWERATSNTTMDTEQHSTEQGASISQVAAARFLDTLSTLHGMACEAKDAVAAYMRRCTCRKHPDHCDRQRAPTDLDQTTTQWQTDTMGLD